MLNIYAIFAQLWRRQAMVIRKKERPLNILYLYRYAMIVEHVRQTLRNVLVII